MFVRSLLRACRTAFYIAVLLVKYSSVTCRTSTKKNRPEDGKFVREQPTGAPRKCLCTNMTGSLGQCNVRKQDFWEGGRRGFFQGGMHSCIFREPSGNLLSRRWSSNISSAREGHGWLVTHQEITQSIYLGRIQVGCRGSAALEYLKEIHRKGVGGEIR